MPRGRLGGFASCDCGDIPFPTRQREFANRCDNDDVMAFVNTLITAQSFGTSISYALRVYTLEMRDKRVMVAEEKANKIPTKMTLCTMAFTLPPLLIVLVGPAIVTILDVVNQ